LHLSTDKFVPIVGVIITVHPMNQNANSGHDVNFTCEASGSPPISYRWLYSGSKLVDDPGHIMDSNTSTVIITNVTATDWGTYICEATNVVNSVTSNKTTLSGECVCGSHTNA